MAVKGKNIRIVAVGKLRTRYWKEACEHYIKQISRWQGLEIVEVRDSDASLGREARMEQEAERIAAQLGQRDHVIALGERGENPTSPSFAQWLDKLELEDARPVFIIGGPFGLAEKILARSDRILSLSQMTWPHELARALLLEQIYRANCIRFNFPYHH